MFEREPEVHPGLLGLENVVLVPHLGSATQETREAMGMLCVEALRAVLLEDRGEPAERGLKGRGAVARRRRGDSRHGRACSSWAETRKSVASRPGRPISCTPIGRPSSLQKSGSDTAGRPVMFATWVNGVKRPRSGERSHGSASRERADRHRRLRERRRQQQVVALEEGDDPARESSEPAVAST